MSAKYKFDQFQRNLQKQKAELPCTECEKSRKSFQLQFENGQKNHQLGFTIGIDKIIQDSGFRQFKFITPLKPDNQKQELQPRTLYNTNYGILGFYSPESLRVRQKLNQKSAQFQPATSRYQDLTRTESNIFTKVLVQTQSVPTIETDIGSIFSLNQTTSPSLKKKTSFQIRESNKFNQLAPIQKARIEFENKNPQNDIVNPLQVRNSFAQKKVLSLFNFNNDSIDNQLDCYGFQTERTQLASSQKNFRMNQPKSSNKSRYSKESLFGETLFRQKGKTVYSVGETSLQIEQNLSPYSNRLSQKIQVARLSQSSIAENNSNSQTFFPSENAQYNDKIQVNPVNLKSYQKEVKYWVDFRLNKTKQVPGTQSTKNIQKIIGDRVKQKYQQQTIIVVE